MEKLDERMVGRVQAWVWDVAEEEPPYPPGYERPTRQTEDGQTEPDNRFPSRDFADALHPPIPLARLLNRVEKWEKDARELPPSKRESFWVLRAKAIVELAQKGYLILDGYKTRLRADGRPVRRFDKELKRRARAAAHHQLELQNDQEPPEKKRTRFQEFHDVARRIRMDARDQQKSLTFREIFQGASDDYGGSPFKNFDSWYASFKQKGYHED